MKVNGFRMYIPSVGIGFAKTSSGLSHVGCALDVSDLANEYTDSLCAELDECEQPRGTGVRRRHDKLQNNDLLGTDNHLQICY